MGCTCKNRSYLEKHGSHLKEWATFPKMDHTSIHGSHVNKWVTLRKMDCTCKHGSHVNKWVTLENWVKPAKMGHIK